MTTKKVRRYRRAKGYGPVIYPGYGRVEEGETIDTMENKNSNEAWELVKGDTGAKFRPMSYASFAGLSLPDMVTYAKLSFDIEGESKRELLDAYKAKMEGVSQPGLTPGPQVSEVGEIKGLKDTDPKTGKDVEPKPKKATKKAAKKDESGLDPQTGLMT